MGKPFLVLVLTILLLVVSFVTDHQLWTYGFPGLVDLVGDTLGSMLFGFLIVCGVCGLFSYYNFVCKNWRNSNEWVVIGALGVTAAGLLYFLSFGASMSIIGIGWLAKFILVDKMQV